MPSRAAGIIAHLPTMPSWRRRGRRARAPGRDDRGVATDRLERVPALHSVSGMITTVTEFARATHAIRNATFGPAELSLLDDGKRDRRRAARDDDGDQSGMADAKRVVEEESDRDRRDGDDREREHAARETLADRGEPISTWVPAVNISIAKPIALRTGSGCAGVDHAEARPAEHEPRDELADHHRDEPPAAEREQRPGEPREHEDRQLREHRAIMPRNTPLVSDRRRHPELRSLGGRAGAAGSSRPRVQARADGAGPVPLSALHLLPLGAGGRPARIWPARRRSSPSGTCTPRTSARGETPRAG